MGVQSGARMIHTVPGVTLDNLITILRHRAAENRGADAIPTIYMDRNCLAISYDKDDNQIPSQITTLITAFVDQGVNVVFVVDGKLRHHSKLATVKRSAEKEGMKIDSFVLRINLMNSVETSRNPALSQSEVSLSQKEVKTKEKRLASRTLPSEFAQKMREHCEELQDDFRLSPNKGTLKFVQAQTQADCVIIHASLKL